MTEAQVRWPLDGPITAAGQGRPRHRAPGRHESRKVLIDLKSGRIVDRHREDLRFYALVETLAREVPPRSVASFSLEAGEAVVDQVSESMLRSSLRRTLDAICPDDRAHRRGPTAEATAERRLLPLPRSRRTDGLS